MAPFFGPPCMLVPVVINFLIDSTLTKSDYNYSVVIFKKTRAIIFNKQFDRRPPKCPIT